MGAAEMVLILDLMLDGDTQARASLDDGVVGDYAESMAAGVKFPPVLVFRDACGLWLADGFHRVAAALKAGCTTIEAHVQDGTQREAQLHSVGANASHGLRRTNADKCKAVTRLLDDAEWCQWSNREIAKRCGVSPSLVDSLRKAWVPFKSSPWIPKPGHRARGEYTQDGVIKVAMVMPSQHFVNSDGKHVNGDEYLYAVVFADSPDGNLETIGMKKAIQRNFVGRVLKSLEFDVEGVEWHYFPVGDDDSADEVVCFDNRWSWPHIVFETHRDWMISERWWMLDRSDPGYLEGKNRSRECVA